MAVTKEQLETAIRELETKKADPSISASDRAGLQADSVKLAAAWRAMGSADQTSPMTTAANPENTNFWYDSAVRGFTNYIRESLIDGTKAPTVLGAEALPFDQSEQVRRQSQQDIDKLFGVEVDIDDPQYQQAVNEAVGAKSTEWFGGANSMPQTGWQRYGGAAVEAVTGDPIMSVVGGRGLLSAVVNVGSSAVAGGGGALGYDALSGTAESLGATPAWQQFWGQTGAFIAGLASGTSAGMTGAGLERVSAARDMVRKQKGVQDSLDKASDFLVTSNMRTVIDDIVTTEPRIDQHIETLRVMSDIIPNFEIAPGIALYDNAVIRKNMETLIKESPKFRAAVETNLRDMGNAITVRRSSLFGTTNPDEIRTAMINTMPNYGVKLNNVVRRRDEIDKGIDRVLTAARTEAEPVNVGTAARRLIDAKEAVVKQEMTVQYDKLINDYTAQGMVFPEDSVGNLWNLVSGALDAKLFTPFPGLVGKVNQLLRPQTIPATEAMPSLGAMLGGRTATIRTPEVTQFRELSLEQLDSLKQELNKALRNSYGQTSYPLLRQMKEALTTEIDKMPGFGEAYRATDRSFYQKLGIPFDAAGLSQLDSLKFTETVGNYLAKPERARDFLSFVGDEGVPVVKDAILMRLRRTAFDTEGNFKPANYAKFLGENKTLLDTVPGMREELRNIGGTVAQMDAVKARLDTQYNAYSVEQADNLLKAVHSRGADKAVGEMLDSALKTDMYLKTVNRLDPESARTVRNGVRNTLLNRAFATPSARDFINQHESLFNQWFGSTYTESVQALSYANDLLRRVDPAKMAYSTSFKEADALANSIGTSAPQVGSLFRDRISSVPHKASILFSRWFTMRTSGRRDEEMMSLLMNPDGLKRISDTARLQRENKIDVNEAVRRVSEVMLTALVSKGSVAQEGAEVAERTPRP
jgi:hypothetical protein